MSNLKVGDSAPDFQLKDKNGDDFSFSSILGKQNVVLYFYPKDETPGCTREACSFRDHYEEFKDAGAEVIGVSADSVKSHHKFAEKRELPFILLSDPDLKAHKLYGIKSRLFGLVRDRVTYVIDRKGIVRNVFNSQMKIERHVNESLEILKGLS